MRSERAIALVIGQMTLLLMPLAPSAAMGGTPMTKTAAPYKLTLEIDPAEMMVAKGLSGEVMLSGQPATCRMPSQAGTNPKVCNRHVEVHAAVASTGKVVTKATVVITLTNVKTHLKIAVPIARTMDSAMGMKDLNFGNNIYAPKGTYNVAVTVNGKSATFRVKLKK